MKSGRIADPLKLLDCSPISDGAAAVVVSSDNPKVQDLYLLPQARLRQIHFRSTIGIRLRL